MLIFAHRGASGYQAENTLIAMQAALDLGAKGIELDVHNVEGELVVFHDRSLEGKSTGKGLIKHKTLAELQCFTVKEQPIPTLWQVLSLVNGQCIVNIELKGDNTTTPLIAMYSDIINKLNFAPEQIIISSFNHPYLAQVKQALPHAYIAPLLGGIPLDLAQSATDLQAYSIHLDLSFINQAIVDDAHQRGAHGIDGHRVGARHESVAQPRHHGARSRAVAGHAAVHHRELRRVQRSLHDHELHQHLVDVLVAVVTLLAQRVEAFNRARIRPGNQHEIRVSLGVRRRAYALDHDVGRHNLLPVKMTAALRHHLIFNVAT